MKLVAPWGLTIKYWSQRISLAIASLPVFYESIPIEWKTQLPPQALYIFSALSLINFIVRNVQQSEVNDQVLAAKIDSIEHSD
jgi:hypothetical protein